MLECNFCKKEFGTTSSLNLHQKTAKYCLKIQGKPIDISDIKCEYCNKTFTGNRNLTSHLFSCDSYKLYIENQQKEEENYKQVLENENNILKEETNKLKEVIEDMKQQQQTIIKRKNKEMLSLKNNIQELKNEIIELKAKNEMLIEDRQTLKDIALQPKITTTTNTNNNKYSMLIPLNYTPDQVTEKVQQSFTENYFLKGQEGVANFTHDILLTNEGTDKKYVCTDPSRNIFNFKNENGEIVKDIKADIITKMISKDVISKSNSICEQSIIDKPEEKHINLERLRQIKKLSYDNTQFMNQLKILTCNTYRLRNSEEGKNNVEEIIDDDKFDEEAERSELEQLKQYLTIDEYNKELQVIEEKARISVF